MKRALYVATRFPLPATGGREQMILQSLNFLATEYSIDFLYFEKQEPETHWLTDIKQMLNGGLCLKIKLPNVIEVALSFFCRRNLSLQEHLFFSQKAMSLISSTIDKNNYDIVIFDMLRTAQYAEYCNIQARKVVELDDLLSKRYTRLLNNAQSNSNILGTFQNKFPGIFGWLLKLMLKPIIKHEISTLTRREREITKYFDVVTLTSPLEAVSLSQCTSHPLIIGVPPTVTIGEKLSALTYSDYKKSKEFDIIFTGNLKSPHNLATLEYIFNNVFNDHISITYSMVVVGDYVQSDIDAFHIPKCLNVVFTGVVDNISLYMKKAKVLLAPIPFGSGIKLKIIDAMANGVPVVTNSIGVEGVPAINRKHILVSDDCGATLAAVNELINDDKLCSYISNNAFDMIESNFCFDDVKSLYLMSIQCESI